MVFKASFEFYGQPHQLSSLPDGEEQEPDTKYHITTNSAGARESYEWTKQERSPFFGPVGPACIRQDKTRQDQVNFKPPRRVFDNVPLCPTIF